MAEEVKCIDECGTTIKEPKLPVYLVIAKNKTIKPKPRCADCLAKYEKTRLEPAGGLRKLSE